MYGPGPFLVERVDNDDPVDGGQKLKFYDEISSGLGEDAPMRSVQDERVWDSRYFTRVKPSH
jgi:hypothetical protein